MKDWYSVNKNISKSTGNRITCKIKTGYYLELLTHEAMKLLGTTENTFFSEFQAIEVWFTDRNSQPLEIEDRINLALAIKEYSHYKN